MAHADLQSNCVFSSSHASYTSCQPGTAKDSQRAVCMFMHKATYVMKRKCPLEKCTGAEQQLVLIKD